MTNADELVLVEQLALFNVADGRAAWLRVMWLGYIDDGSAAGR